MSKKLNLLAYILVLLTSGCVSDHATEAIHSLENGSHLVEVIADSTLIIDKEAQSGQAKFYLENKSDETINNILVFSSSASVVIDNDSDCHKPLSPHATCEVSYTGNLNKSKNKDSVNVSATFTAEKTYKSDGVIDMLRNPDTSAPHFVVVNMRARKNDDSEFIIHGVGSNIHKYTINTINVNGHKLRLPNNATKATLSGGENLTILVPTDVVNETDPYTSQMKFNLQGSVDNSPANLLQNFIVGAASGGFVYEPNSGYINPTYNLNIATVGVVNQAYSMSYLASIPADAVTDNTTHTFTATLQPTTATASNMQCAQLISFVSNSCTVSVTGSNGTSAGVANSNCVESIVVDPTKWGNTTQYLQCQYVPQIKDSSGKLMTLNPGGVLTVNLSNMNNPVSAAMLVDNVGYVAAVNVNAGALTYGGNSALPFGMNGSVIKSPTYRWVQIYNYESVESIQLYYQVPSLTAGQNANLIESPSAVTSALGSTATACHSGGVLAPGANCYVLMLVAPNDYAGVAGDMVTLQAKYTSLTSGRVSYYSTNLYMQYSGFFQYLGNMSTVMGGPSGTAFNESMPETVFTSEAVNGVSGGSTASQCGTNGNNNTYQCIVQGSYLNVKLPLVSSFLPGQFNYVLADESELTAQGFKITYALADTANPSNPATTWGVGTGGCKIPAYSLSSKACYINIKNIWSPNNTASGNIELNVVGYFASNPNLQIQSNGINFYAIKPTSKVLSMYNYTTSQPYSGAADTTIGGDTYWQSGESWGFVWNESNPNSSAIGTGRFFLLNNDQKCVVDKLTGLIWYTNVISNTSISTSLSQAVPIVCGGVTYATADGSNISGGSNWSGTKSRLPSQRELMTVLDFRYNNTSSKSLLNFSTGLNFSSLKTLGLLLSNPVNGYLTSSTFRSGQLPVIFLATSGTTPSCGMDGSPASSLYMGFLVDNSVPFKSSYATTNYSCYAYVDVATIPNAVLTSMMVTPTARTLKSSNNMPSYNSNDAGAQESGLYSANSNGGSVGLPWPTAGSAVVNAAYGGVGRYVNDPTGNCFIDLATGLIYQSVYGPVSATSGGMSTDLPSLVTKWDKAGGSNYAVCGLKNWRVQNIREAEATYNYAVAGVNAFTRNSHNAMIDSWYGGLNYVSPSPFTKTITSGSLPVISSTTMSPLGNNYYVVPTNRNVSTDNYNEYFGTDYSVGSGYSYIMVAGGSARIQP